MRRVIVLSMIFANIVIANPLNLDCVPKGMDGIKGVDGRPPMVLHLVLGTETTGKLEASDLKLSSQESGATMSLEINFATHINQPGRSADIPVPVSSKGAKIMIGSDSGHALLLISDIKSALAGNIHSFEIEFTEKNQNMPFNCHVKK